MTQYGGTKKPWELPQPEYGDFDPAAQMPQAAGASAPGMMSQFKPQNTGFSELRKELLKRRLMQMQQMKPPAPAQGSQWQ